MSKTHFVVAAAAFGDASDRATCQWSLFFWRWDYKMVLLSVHICYWCWRRCWCWDWCGATYSHVKRHRDCTQMVMEHHNLKCYRFQHISNLSFPAHLQTTKDNFHSHEGSCLNLLAICSCAYSLWEHCHTLKILIGSNMSKLIYGISRVSSKHPGNCDCYENFLVDLVKFKNVQQKQYLRVVLKSEKDISAEKKYFAKLSPTPRLSLAVHVGQDF